MATFASDTFYAADNTNIDGKTMDVGGPWVLQTGYTAGYLKVVSNKAFQAPLIATASGAAYATAAPGSADYSVQATIATGIAGSDGLAGVTGRASTSAHTMYFADYYDHVTAGSRQWRLVKIVAGAGTVLGTYTQNLGSSASATLKLDMSGTTIKAYVDGVERISATDSSITAAGRAGIRMGNVPDLVTGPSLDDFSAFDATAPGPAAVRRNFNAFRGVYTR